MTADSVDRGARTYDELPYEGRALPRTHPRNLQAVATVLGLDAPPAEGCRVLELGCAEGGNLLPMAWGLPGSCFVGIDYSAHQIAEAEAARAALGLDNVEFRCVSITDMDEDFGEFDYIIAHGVYSWVPASVQDSLLAICAERLTLSGVAYISYNTYPGWQLQGVIRDLLRRECAGIEAPARAVERARETLAFLAETLPGEPGTACALVRDEMDQLQQARPSYLYHEYLEECNEPLHFETFVARAADHGLECLGEAQFSAMADNTLPPEMLQWIAGRAGDPVGREQYLDYITMRRFRQSLLVRRNAPRRDPATPPNLSGLHVTGRLRAGPRAGGQQTFLGETGGAVTVTAPVVGVALGMLAADAGPVAFAALAERAAAAVPAASRANASATLAAALVSAFGKELVTLAGGAPPYTGAVSDRPTAATLARRQAGTAAEVVNLRHEMVRPSALERVLLELADGSRTRQDLLREVLARVREGTLSLGEGAVPDDTAVAVQVRDALLALAARALLVA